MKQRRVGTIYLQLLVEFLWRGVLPDPTNSWASCQAKRVAICVHRRSFVVVIRQSITKLAGRIFQERFVLESPMFTPTSVPVCSTTTPDKTPLATFGRKLSRKYCRKKCIRCLRVEFLQNGLNKDSNISYTYPRQKGSYICWIWSHQPPPVGCKVQMNNSPQKPA